MSTRIYRPIARSNEELEPRIVLDATAELVFDFGTEGYRGDAVVVGDVVYFSADDGSGDIELWKSDGSVEGTARVKDIRVGRKPSIPQQLSSANGSVYFTAYDNQHGRELWVSDGTEAGTIRLTDFEQDLRYQNIVESGDLIYFTVWDSNGSLNQIWQSDGTAPGTTIVVTLDFSVHQIHPIDPPDSASRMALVASDTGFWFVDLADQSSNQLFVSGDAFVHDITQIGGEFYFRVQNEERVWLRRVDLATMQTEQVLDAGTAHLVGPVSFEGDLIYAMQPNRRGTGPLTVFRSDGFEGDATEVLHVDSGIRHVEIHSVDGRLYFNVRQNNATQLWVSDGSAEGTEQYFASFNFNFGESLAVGRDFYIQAWNRREETRAIWQFTGDDEPHGVVNVQGLTAFVGALGDRLLFRVGELLMTTDGTPDGTVPLVTNQPSLANVSGIQLDSTDVLVGSTNGLVIKTGDMSLYQTDGSAAGITRVETSGQIYSNDRVIVADDLVYFRDNEHDGPSNLFALNPVSGELRNIQPPSVTEFYVESLPIADPTARAEFFFQAESDAGENGNFAAHIWVSDGTNEGTRTVLELDGASEALVGGLGSNLLAWNDTIVFQNEDGDLKRFDGSSLQTLTSDVAAYGVVFYSGESVFYLSYDGEFIASDGTVDGTTIIASGQTHGISGELVGDRLFFVGEDQTIWMSDGTSDSTRPVVEDADYEAKSLLGKLGQDVFFVDFEDALWKTDGTVKGTIRVTTEVAASTWLGARAFADDGYLYFNGRHLDSEASQWGGELWRTDGTVEGTQQLTDIAPGFSGSNPKYFTKVNGFLYFAASDGFRGTELWRYPLDPVPGDADGNGAVSFVDFLQLSANFGMVEEALHSEGDFNFDGAINFEDFLLLSANFGEKYPVG